MDSSWYLIPADQSAAERSTCIIHQEERRGEERRGEERSRRVPLCVCTSGRETTESIGRFSHLYFGVEAVWDLVAQVAAGGVGLGQQEGVGERSILGLHDLKERTRYNVGRRGDKDSLNRTFH